MGLKDKARQVVDHLTAKDIREMFQSSRHDVAKMFLEDDPRQLAKTNPNGRKILRRMSVAQAVVVPAVIVGRATGLNKLGLKLVDKFLDSADKQEQAKKKS